MTRAGRAGKTHNTPLTDICRGSLAPKCQRGYRPLLSSPISWWQERGEEGSLLSPSRASLHGPEDEHTARAVEKVPGARRRYGAAVITATPCVKVSFPEKDSNYFNPNVSALHSVPDPSLQTEGTRENLGFLKFLQTERSGFRGFGEISLRLPCR